MNELKDTIDLMTSADYKDRFKAEYWQTQIRANKLQAVLQKHEAGELDFAPDCPIELLYRQFYYMCEYLNALRKRAVIEGVGLGWPRPEPPKEVDHEH